MGSTPPVATNPASRPGRGRFAPSPTGALHFGSLLAAVASYLDARSRGAEWLVRIEDVDTPRARTGAADEILRTLEAYGFEWNGPVLYQSRRGERYTAALEQLVRAGLAYPCACTRREVAARGRHGIDGPVYPGTCRTGLPPGRGARAGRLDPRGQVITFVDELQGQQRQALADEIGDYVLKRADGVFAYQLAVVVDDADQGIERVVRGADLLDSTPRQIHLQGLLGLATPAYLHIPVATDAAGAKLSKQTRAAPIDLVPAGRCLAAALRFLGQPLATELERWPPARILAWAQTHWHPAAVPPRRAVPAPGDL